MSRPRFSRGVRPTHVIARVALTVLLAFRLVILPSLASANPAPQVDPDLLPICTVYGLYYVDLRTGEKVPAEDQDQHKLPKPDDCTFCHFVCHGSAVQPNDTASDILPIAYDIRVDFTYTPSVWNNTHLQGFQSRAPPVI